VSALPLVVFTWDADDGGYDETRPLASVEAFDALVDAHLARSRAAESSQLWKPDMLGKTVRGPGGNMADTSYIELSALGVSTTGTSYQPVRTNSKRSGPSSNRRSRGGRQRSTG
jgi:hypothetical protein